MREIGGYFELELRRGEHFHKSAIALNSGRACLKYLLERDKPNKIHIPAYCCDSLLEPAKEVGTDIEFYHLNDCFDIAQLPELQPGERICYINYFGLKSEYLKVLANHFGEKLIIDNTQAFFELPIADIDTFYSPRKFLGVADGGYLYTNKRLDHNTLDIDQSHERMSHLLGRVEEGANAFYQDFVSTEAALSRQPVRLMSQLTNGILKALDYDQIIQQRRANADYLREKLDLLGFKYLSGDNDWTAMALPLISSGLKLKEKLIRRKVYVATYWPECHSRLNKEEARLMSSLCALPVDQRYEAADMDRIVSEIALCHDGEKV